MVAYAPHVSGPQRLRARRAGRRLPGRRGAHPRLLARARIFEKSLARRRGAPRFVFYEGPPTANGLPHNGHVLTRVMKDVIPRYKTMRGFDVPRQAGWDTHGLPVEVEVEKELRISGKAAIERLRRRALRAPLPRVRLPLHGGVGELHREARLLGRHRRRVRHLPPVSYVESVWWALSRLFEKGLLYQGHKVVWWWAQGGTALSAAEVGEGYRTVDDPSRLRAASRSRTSPGTSLLRLDDDALDAALEQLRRRARRRASTPSCATAQQRLIVAAALREALAEKVGRELPVVRTLRGAELVGRRYAPPFDWYARRAARRRGLWRVVAADFVELDAGTGIVHIAPAFGEVDFELLRARARERPGAAAALRGAPRRHASTPRSPSPSRRALGEGRRPRPRCARCASAGSSVHAEQIRHDYPFCGRSDEDPLIQYARPAWYIRTTAHVERALANNARDPLAARAHPGRPLRRLPAQQRRLGALARALLGHAAQRLGERRDRAHGGAGVGRGDPASATRARSTPSTRRGEGSDALAAPARAQAVDRSGHLDARRASPASTAACPR